MVIGETPVPLANFALDWLEFAQTEQITLQPAAAESFGGCPPGFFPGIGTAVFEIGVHL